MHSPLSLRKETTITGSLTFLGSSPGGNQRGQSCVEKRGNLYHLFIHPSVNPSIPPRQAQASQRLAFAFQRLVPDSKRLAKASQRLAQTSLKLAQAYKRLAQASQTLTQVSERLIQVSERLVQVFKRLALASKMPVMAWYCVINCNCNRRTLYCRATIGFRVVHNQFPISNIVMVLPCTCLIIPMDDLVCLLKVRHNRGKNQKPLILKLLNLSGWLANGVISECIELEIWG